jgi:hypothetical protein
MLVRTRMRLRMRMRVDGKYTPSEEAIKERHAWEDGLRE